jgi:signal transduction histidine kinase
MQTLYEDRNLFAMVIDAGEDIQRLKALCQAARKDEALSGVRILTVTPNKSEARQAALAAGADDLLTAPLDQVELIHALKRLPLPGTEVLKGAGDYDVLGHDLKGPIGTVISSLDLIATLPHTDETVHSLVVDCLYTARREHMLLENLIDYLRILDNNMPVDIASTHVMPLLVEFIEHAAPIAERRGISVSLDVIGDVPNANVDQRYLRRILDALFDNAMKFCTRGCQFVVKIRPNEHMLEFELRDNGRAVATQFEQQIFGEKRQLEMRINGSRASVAANLPFSRAAARLMGGDVQVKSQGEWTAFTLTLPIAEE